MSMPSLRAQPPARNGMVGTGNCPQYPLALYLKVQPTAAPTERTGRQHIRHDSLATRSISSVRLPVPLGPVTQRNSRQLPTSEQPCYEPCCNVVVFPSSAFVLQALPNRRLADRAILLRRFPVTSRMAEFLNLRTGSADDSTRSISCQVRSLAHVSRGLGGTPLLLQSSVGQHSSASRWQAIGSLDCPANDRHDCAAARFGGWHSSRLGLPPSRGTVPTRSPSAV